jgi:hypothetical protein
MPCITACAAWLFAAPYKNASFVWVAAADESAGSISSREVAEHQLCWQRHQTITDPVHRAAAETLHELPPMKATAQEPEVERRSLLTTT